jgi:small acid-soluble spore protein H (minor)
MKWLCRNAKLSFIITILLVILIEEFSHDSLRKGDFYMDRRRATEIASSPDMIDVTYDGELIYIENINTVRDTASVHYLSQPGNSREVELTQLVEAR